jgi:hypothetical protein
LKQIKYLFKKQKKINTFMERFLPYNYDGSSCFLNSLLCALFFPIKLQVIDPYVLQGQRADMKHLERQHLCHVLSVVAKCFRGSRSGDVATFTAVRPLIAHMLVNLGNVNFAYGQHDPVDLFEALLRVYNVGGVFTTKKTVQSLYRDGKRTTSVSVDEMFRHSVLYAFSGSGGVLRFESLFPSVETIETEEELVRQRTIIEFGGGPILVLTRETFRQPVQYGRWSTSTNACILPVLNTLEKCVQWYELQSVLCWKGHVGPTGETGHYVCFVYEDVTKQWYFYNDLLSKADGLAGLDPVSQLEAHSEYPPSTTGTMFLYARVGSRPNDV